MNVSILDRQNLIDVNDVDVDSTYFKKINFRTKKHQLITVFDYGFNRPTVYATMFTSGYT